MILEFVVVRRQFLWEALEIIQIMECFGHYLDGKETNKKKSACVLYSAAQRQVSCQAAESTGVWREARKF